jgi:hypothetical protein
MIIGGSVQVNSSFPCSRIAGNVISDGTRGFISLVDNLGKVCILVRIFLGNFTWHYVVDPLSYEISFPKFLSTKDIVFPIYFSGELRFTKISYNG